MVLTRCEPDTLSSTKDIVPRTWCRTIDAVIHIDARLSSGVVLRDPTDMDNNLWKRGPEDLCEEIGGLHPMFEPDSGITIYSL